MNRKILINLLKESESLFLQHKIKVIKEIPKEAVHVDTPILLGSLQVLRLDGFKVNKKFYYAFIWNNKPIVFFYSRSIKNTKWLADFAISLYLIAMTKIRE